MKIISARSPYQIIINVATMTSSRIELFIWDRSFGPINPFTIPTYVLSEKIASVTQLETNYNISPFLLEYLNPINPTNVAVVTPEDYNTWCLCEVKRYRTIAGVEALIDTTLYTVVNGYTEDIDGLNYDITIGTKYCLLGNTSIKTITEATVPYYNFICENDPVNNFTVTYYNAGLGVIATNTIQALSGVFNIMNYKVPMLEPTLATTFVEIKRGASTIYSFSVEKVEECKYTPNVCAFVNKKGGWSFITFLKASATNISTKGSSYDLTPKVLAYDYKIGQSKRQNVNGSKTIKVNSGWVDENTSILITELLLSERIVLNGFPVIIKTESTLLKKWIKDRNINYEIEFEYSNSLINNFL